MHISGLQVSYVTRLHLRAAYLVFPACSNCSIWWVNSYSAAICLSIQFHFLPTTSVGDFVSLSFYFFHIHRVAFQLEVKAKEQFLKWLLRFYSDYMLEIDENIKMF